jgi:single-strand DNA-binding protein
VNDGYGEKEYTSFFDVVVWGKTAENIKPYIGKGKQLCINGRLRQDRWEKDGQKNSRVTIVAETVQLLGGRDNGAQPQSAPQQAPQNDGYAEDIPF